ncbi:MAG: glycine zipper family protein [Alphaproteobacteria bacterium]|nr:glycine zipper family protein [Alphaproteobacteria bacterium]
MKNKVCKISLFSAILASISALPVDARVVVNTKNAGRSYADAYQQVNAVRYQQEYMNATATNATTSSATANLPVRVSDEKLASAILSNTSETTVAHLENCAMIYPNGVFMWAVPESGIRQNQLDQCVAEVSLVDANTNIVLATTTLAAGDAMKCNIDSFPENGMNVAALSKVILPADDAPTMADVEAVMNQEQKQNAGIKIAAGAIIHAVAGNILAPKDAGDTKLLGTGKNRMTGTAIGAVTGAGIEAAGAYSGKVAGDTIKSTVINAEAGAIVGNMLAGASSDGEFLTIKKCTVDKKEYDCVVGRVEKEGDDFSTKIKEAENSNKFYIVKLNGTDVRLCETDNNDPNKYKCSPYSNRLLNIEVKGRDGSVSLKNLKDSNKKQTPENFEISERYAVSDEGSSVFEKITDARKKADDAYFVIASATATTGMGYPAYAVMKSGISSKFGGHKTSEWGSTIGKTEGSYTLRYRNSDGSVGSEISPKSDKEENTSAAKFVFTPTSGSADDGDLIDFSNPGRTKGTVAGAATGGALGGFAGYQGAKTEITDRWVAASREYEDSLSNFVCMTGTRFLGKYNDYIEIPEPNKSE